MSEFKLPDIGEGIVECEVVEWHIAEGDRIEEDQPVVEVMTDKALVEITAPEAGVVTALHVAQGKIAKVHAPLYAYQGSDEHGDEHTSNHWQRDSVGNDSQHDDRPGSDAPDNDAKGNGTETRSARLHDGQGSPGDAERAGKAQADDVTGGRVPASPAVRRLVREHQLALGDIVGSGKQGRVLKEDVLAHLEQHNAAGPGGDITQDVAPRIEPLRGVRAAMAKKMVASASTIPHFHYGEELDVTALLALRERLKPLVEAEGGKLTLMPFFMKAMALSIAHTPIINAQLDVDASELHYYSQCNIGMAVDSKVGLLVPNVKHVERLSLLEICAEVSRLTSAAREGRVAQADLVGGTISISNIGALGGTYAAPIINAPEAAIVAIGKTQWLPRFDEQGNVERRAILTVTWAGDHRFIDGGSIARFCNRWKGYLEAPDSMLLHLR